MGNKTSLNVYIKYLDCLEPFKIFTITNLRKGEVVRNDEPHMRLQTTNFTTIELGTAKDNIAFENVSNGDNSINGEIIGTGDVMEYYSCKLHFTKLSDSNDCSKCKKLVDDKQILKDYRVEIYIEERKIQDIESEETNVVEILFFKRVLGGRPSETIDELVGKKVKVDYNVDDAGRFIGIALAAIK